MIMPASQRAESSGSPRISQRATSARAAAIAGFHFRYQHPIVVVGRKKKGHPRLQGWPAQIVRSAAELRTPS